MRIRVTHELSVAFRQKARSLHLALRMAPRSFESQYMLKWRVGVDLDATLRLREDAFGSIVHELSWHKPTESVTITALGEVQTSDAVGVVRGAVETLPPSMFLRVSPLAQANPALRAFAEAAGEGASDPLDRLHRLKTALHNELLYESGFGGEAPAAEAFALKRGGSADFAHAFIACARLQDIPARFVTGYRCDDTNACADEMFAWAEALTPGLGWVAFDAVNDVCADDRYIRVASGIDARDASPLRLWHSGGESEVTASVRVEPAGGQGQSQSQSQSQSQG